MTAAVTGSTLTLTAAAAGTATVTVTAEDPDGLSATQQISVTVNRPPRAVGSIPALTLSLGGSAVSVNVSQYFTDPDGDALTYSASSSRTGIVRPSVSRSTVTLTA